MFTDSKTQKNVVTSLMSELQLKKEAYEQEKAVAILTKNIKNNTDKDGLLNKKHSEFINNNSQGCCAIF
eukprot:GAHX01002532.1.p1 GENE.GAHX01002532.1~~GAHX01002532.1.p1  ORF type:complete len:69 (-),score=22.53 GAHX01002532.1:43-249(-)